MELKEIDEKKYLEFALKSKNISIYQLPEWGKLKETTGWKTHLLGIYQSDKLKGVTMLLQKDTPIKKSLFYSPRGLLFDLNDFNLLQEFTVLVKKYIKDHKGFMLKVDPNVIYSIMDQAGENKNIIGENIITNFTKLNYKHLGFTKNFETMQPRYLCRFKLLDTYDETLKSFTKSTRKNIEKTKKMGVKTRLIDEREMDLFVSLLEETGKNKNFIVRPASYYKKMYELMSKYMKLYIAYIDTNAYYSYLIEEKDTCEKELATILKQMDTNNVGNKLKTAKMQHENKLLNLNKAISDALEMRKTADKINIGALMSLFIGNEGITFMSGTSNSYKNFNPKYAFYNDHIIDCFKEKKEYCNFYGISGDLNPDGPYYSIYEIKKGFNPEIIELIGEFDLIINRFDYILYKVALKFYRLLKKVKH